MTTLLLTPGPLSTHADTRAALAEDRGSRDPAFTAMDAGVWDRIADLVGAEDPEGDWACVPMQGSGTFSVEAMLGTMVPPTGRLLVAVNGAYGRRMVQICERIGRSVVDLLVPEDQPVTARALESALASRGFAIYPGKLTARPSFRVGCIGQVFPADLRRFVTELDAVMAAQGVASGSPPGGGNREH